MKAWTSFTELEVGQFTTASTLLSSILTWCSQIINPRSETFPVQEVHFFKLIYISFFSRASKTNFRCCKWSSSFLLYWCHQSRQPRTCLGKNEAPVALDAWKCFVHWTSRKASLATQMALHLSWKPFSIHLPALFGFDGSHSSSLPLKNEGSSKLIK